MPTKTCPLDFREVRWGKSKKNLIGDYLQGAEHVETVATENSQGVPCKREQEHKVVAKGGWQGQEKSACHVRMVPQRTVDEKEESGWDNARVQGS